MAELKGVDYLRSKLAIKRPRVDLRYDYYEMKNAAADFRISTPPDLQQWMPVLGWCAAAVDKLSDRLVFREFSNDDFELNEIFSYNDPDVLFDSAINSSLISSCCFVYISEDADGYPYLEVLDGSHATGIKDERTGLLSEGYAVLKRDEYGNPLEEAYFIAGQTEFYRKGEKNKEIIKNDAPYPLLVPIIYRPDARRPFGHSRISRACMSITSSALRTVKRSEISSEFFSFPQRYVLGLSEDAEPMDKWRATMSSFIEITQGEDGEKPTMGQFQQQSMAPHVEHLRMFASMFGGETGLTLDDLGFATENPSSAEAIKAAHENLRLAARKAQRTFGSGFLNVGYLAACVRDHFPYERRQLYRTTPRWEPLFEPDFSAFSSIGDGIQKLAVAAPGYLGRDNLQDMLGVKPSADPLPAVDTSGGE